MTTWWPDTCKCVLEFRDGAAQPPTHVKRCAEHARATGLDVWDENQSIQAAALELGSVGIDPRAVRGVFRPNNGGKRDATIMVDRAIPHAVRRRIAANPHGRVRLQRET